MSECPSYFSHKLGYEGFQLCLHLRIVYGIVFRFPTPPRADLPMAET
jgi:hypothetical protein